jgi:integrase
MMDAPKRSRKQPNVLRYEDIFNLLNNIKRPEILASVIFLIDTGARLGELYNLKKQDMACIGDHYIAKISGKTGMRVVPISYITYQMMLKTIPFLMTRHHLGQLIALSFKGAGIIGTAHTLRHTFATLWGGSDLVLQRIMGHAHMDMVQQYRNMRVEALCAEHNKYTPLSSVNITNYQPGML